MNWDCTIHSTETPQINLQHIKRAYRYLQRLHICSEALNKTILNLNKSQNHSTKLGFPDPPFEAGRVQQWSQLYKVWLCRNRFWKRPEASISAEHGHHKSTTAKHTSTHYHKTTNSISKPGHSLRFQVQAKRGSFPAVNAFRNLPVCASHTPIPVLILQQTTRRKDGMTKEKGIKQGSSISFRRGPNSANNTKPRATDLYI